ncbi:uncharacterized protein [Nicotiana tomentosiformis]|uniref:uncharacterized protein n=1 Tax=Nicotiana tomentosiformis TaxID=4098 RepID=UPI00388C5195
MPKAKAPMPRPPPPYPQRIAKKNIEYQFKKFINIMKSLSINVPLVEALEKMPGYAKFMMDLVTKKRSINCETIKMTHQVSAIVRSMALKLEDPGAFTIPCTIGSANFAKALCDLGASINFDSLLGVQNFGNWATKTHIYEVINGGSYYEETIGPFLTTGKAFVNVEAGELTFRVGDDKVVFHVCKCMRKPNSNAVCSFVDLVTEEIVDDSSAMMNVDDTFGGHIA